jgi:hypothetical protein
MHGPTNVKCGILVQDLRSLRRVTLKMDAARSTETSVNIYQRTHRHMQDNWILRRNCCRENIGHYAERSFFVTHRQIRTWVTFKTPRTLNQQPIKSHAYIQRKRIHVFHNNTWLQGGPSRKCASIPVEGKKFNSIPKHPERLWGPSALLCNGHRGAFPRVKRPRREVDPSHPYNDKVKSEWRCT